MLPGAKKRRESGELRPQCSCFMSSSQDPYQSLTSWPASYWRVSENSDSLDTARGLAWLAEHCVLRDCKAKRAENPTLCNPTADHWAVFEILLSAEEQTLRRVWDAGITCYFTGVWPRRKPEVPRALSVCGIESVNHLQLQRRNGGGFSTKLHLKMLSRISSCPSLNAFWMSVRISHSLSHEGNVSMKLRMCEF